MKRSFPLGTALLLLVQLCLYGQSKEVDSLRSLITTSSNEETKLKACLLLADKLSAQRFNESIRVSEIGIELAGKRKDSVSIALLTRNMGVSNYFKGNYDKAATLLYKSAGIFERHSRTIDQAKTYNDIAKLFRKTRDLPRSLQFYEKAQRLYEQENNISGIQMIQNESGVVYEYMGKYDEALSRYQRSLELAIRQKDEIGKSWCYNFIGGVYQLQKQFERSEDYHLRALAIRSRLKDTFSMALSYSDLGALYSNWGQTEKADAFFETSNRLAEKMQYTELLSHNYSELSKVADRSGDHARAFKLLQMHTSLKDSLFNLERSRQIEEISTLYETEKKEQQIRLQQLTIRKRNLQLWLIGGSLVLTVLIAYLFYKRYKWKQQLKLQEAIVQEQKQATYAVLAAEEKERNRIARDLHDGVGQMMSAARMNLSTIAGKMNGLTEDDQRSLGKILSLVDDSCREVRAVSHSMMPSVLSSKGLPEATKEMTDRIDPSLLTVSLHAKGWEQRPDLQTETILYRVIQECLHNILKHSGATHADISMIRDTDGISITIEDDGLGFDLAALRPGSGIGLENILSRIGFLKGKADIDTAPGKGTLIAIHLPSRED